MAKIVIPALPQAELVSRAARIKALTIPNDGGKIFCIDGIGLNDPINIMHPKRGEALESVAVFRDITTYHPFREPHRFMPTVAEVLAQIPEDLLVDAIGYRFVGFQGLPSEEQIAFVQEFTPATMRLYRRS